MRPDPLPAMAAEINAAGVKGVSMLRLCEIAGLRGASIAKRLKVAGFAYSDSVKGWVHESHVPAIRAASAAKAKAWKIAAKAIKRGNDKSAYMAWRDEFESDGRTGVPFIHRVIPASEAPAPVGLVASVFDLGAKR